MGEPRLLSGWGRTAPTAAELAPIRSVDDAVEAVRRGRSRGLIARGLARSYGDAAQNAGGQVLDLRPLARVRRFDGESGVIDVEAGISLDALIRLLLPLGWFVPVSPGTRHVSVGGAFAADIHGKNHHVSGSWCQQVDSIELLDADGEIRQVTAADDPELFWATAGGMGLTGVILAATIRLLPVETASMVVDTERAPNLDALLDELRRTDDAYTYSVAWIDLLARGESMGRSVLTRGWHASAEQVRGRRGHADVQRFAPRAALPAPPAVPSGLLNPLTVRAFNEVWWRKSPVERRGQLQPLAAFFHPLDGVRGWNRGYGRRGFVQYQLVVPFGAEGALRAAVERISSSGQASFLAVLKRFGPGNPGPLSFPMPGWTLALDLPVRAGLDRLLDGLDELVADAEGRVYLAKDSRLSPAVLRRMYPRLDEFAAVRDKVDPQRRFASDLSRRLGL